MNIGFISTWFERGAAYVTRNYMNLLKVNHNVYVFARGGEKYAKNDPVWDTENVTWGLNLISTEIYYPEFKKWIKKNQIETLFFNEQHDIEIIAKTRKDFPRIKIGSYIDYYKEDTVKDFRIYDFLICNTKRHYSVFKDHPQCYYVPWGTQIDVFVPQEKESNKFCFFHSVGMSGRKGTDILIESFIEGKLYEEAELIIHTQLDFEKNFNLSLEDALRYNIRVIEKTVSAPGLYHLGDVYIYPTTLDGLGLTIFEALSVGLPVITTDAAPMNEIINDQNGYLVEIEKTYSRSNGYYWPLTLVNKKSLIDSMKFYIGKKNNMEEEKSKVRDFAMTSLNWNDRTDEVNEIFVSSKKLNLNTDLNEVLNNYKKKRMKNLFYSVLNVLPKYLQSIIYDKMHSKIN